MLSEALLYTGNLLEAHKYAQFRNGAKPQDAGSKARSLLLIGLAECELGRDEGPGKLQQAALIARQAGKWDLASRALLNVLERTCDSTEYRLSLPLCADTITAVRHSGERATFLEAHLTFARLEARIGRIDAARRHLALARLNATKHSSLLSLADLQLCLCNIAALSGDLAEALEAANRADSLSSESGWLKGQCAAAMNLGYLCLAQGKYEEAERHLTNAERLGGSWIDYAVGLTVTKAQLAISRGDHAQADVKGRDGDRPEVDQRSRAPRERESAGRFRIERVEPFT